MLVYVSFCSSHTAVFILLFIFFFKQKTAYEMRISDWSSDVCSSDLVDVDALCDGDDVVVAGVLQHIEEAGVHSGDSACSLPPYSLSDDIIAEIGRASCRERVCQYV